MKKIKGLFFSFFFAFSLLSISALYANDFAWDKFTSEEGKFTTQVPCQPTYKHNVKHSVVGPIDENTYTCTINNYTFVSEYSDLPAIAIYLGGRKHIYRNSKKAFLKDVGGVEISFENIEIQNFPAKELVYETMQDIGKARFVLVSKRLYVLQTYTLRNAQDLAPFATFLDSFDQKFGKFRPPTPHIHKYKKMQSDTFFISK